MSQQHFTAADFERHYLRYKAEGFPRGESMEGYCFRHGIPHNLFDKWYRDTRHRIVPVQVDGAPKASAKAKGETSEKPVEKPQGPKASVADVETKPEAIRILVHIKASNGLKISQRNLSYEGLAKLVGSLEGLC